MISAWLIPLLGTVGLIVGSFLGLLSLRLPLSRPVVFGRSHCQGCDRALAPWDLIPVLSYLAFRGRCRTCRSSIPWRYPAMELAGAVIGIWAAVHAGGDAGRAMATALLGWQLLILAAIDAEHFWLPDVLTFPLAITGIAAAALIDPANLRSRLIGVGVGFAMLQAVRVAYRIIRKREGLGGGDPFLMAGIGAWLGWTGLPTALLVACVVGFAVIGVQRVRGRDLQWTDRLPFGALLALGCWLTWLFGTIG